jgi:hypothetical protein
VKALTLASLAVLVSAALLAARWLRDDGTAAVAESVEARLDTTVTPTRSPELGPQESAPPVVASAGFPAVRFTSESELFDRVDQESYAKGGGVFVDHLVQRGLARSDAERIVREAVRESTACLRDALRLEAEAQGADHDAVLYALESTLGDGDGPFLWTVIDLAAVQSRAAPCVLTVTQRAGISPSFFENVARPARR